uniref:Protein p8 MTCP-1 n=1 Tax=Magallana gigas TaxID=29159 RepID=K1QU91_MAGGI
MPNQKRDPCQKQACDIQHCFVVHGHNRQKCQPVIDALKKCCEQPGTENSVVCDGMRPANNPNMKS